MNKILISFSGGRTSAFMCKLILEHPTYKDYEKLFVFANTGKERDKHELSKLQRTMFETEMDLEFDCFCKMT